MKLILIFFTFLFYSTASYSIDMYRISWCSSQMQESVLANYMSLKGVLEKRSTLVLPKNILVNECEIGNSEIWWFDGDAFAKFNLNKLKEHISNGGIFIVEGLDKQNLNLNIFNDKSIGLEWENPQKNGMFYRSFYLLQTMDGCPLDSTKVLMLKKKLNAQAPIGLLTKAHFLSTGFDCFNENEDYRIRSFVNILFAFMTTDYKEDQRELPEILNRIRNLGLVP